jgi:hypothetical protein
MYGSGSGGYTTVKGIHIMKTLQRKNESFFQNDLANNVHLMRATGSWKYWINWNIGPFTSYDKMVEYSSWLVPKTFNNITGVIIERIEYNYLK